MSEGRISDVPYVRFCHVETDALQLCAFASRVPIIPYLVVIFSTPKSDSRYRKYFSDMRSDNFTFTFTWCVECCLNPEWMQVLVLICSSWTISKYELSKRKLKYVPRLPSFARREIQNFQNMKCLQHARQIQYTVPWYIEQLLTKYFTTITI